METIKLPVTMAIVKRRIEAAHSGRLDEVHFIA
jgi:hypothetical protein